jgi:hypothetical protein
MGDVVDDSLQHSDGLVMFRRWQRYNEAVRQTRRDAATLMIGFGSAAYEEARQRAWEARQGQVVDANRPPGHWDRVRAEIGRRTGRRSWVDTATRYLDRG